MNTPDEEKTTTLREEGFFETSHGVKICIVFLFGIFLFSFLHFREVYIETLEFGKSAPHYVVAQIDFSFPDEEATTILKQEALLDIGKIYAIDPDDIRKRRVDFENILIYDQEWRNNVKQSTFDVMYRAVERLEQELLEIRFSDARTIEKMKELGISTKQYCELAPFDPTQGAFFPEKVWDFIKQKAFGHQLFNEATVDFVIDFLKNRIWKLKEDSQVERKIRKILQQNVQQKYTFVHAGSRIIDQGEKVTARHMTMLQAMKHALAEKRNLWYPKTILGSLLLTFIVMFVGALFLKKFHKDIVNSNKRLLLLLFIVTLGLFLAKVTEFVLLKTTHELY